MHSVITIQEVSATELDRILPALADLLSETVNGGTPLGFLPPLSHHQAKEYWVSLRPSVQAGSRILLVAQSTDGVIGSVQLSLELAPNGRHRAELQKLFVAAAARGHGIGKSLMTAMHHAARERGRALLLLNTRRGEPAELFYKALGYREAGVVPGWSVGPTGERYDHVRLYHELAL